MKVIVGCPTYRKFDLCVKMIESAFAGSVMPDAFLIVDNSAGGFTKYTQENGILFDSSVMIVEPTTNIGVAAAWNYILEAVTASVEDALTIIVNDDVLFNETTIQRLVDKALVDSINNGEYDIMYATGGESAINAFSLFAVHAPTFLEVLGRFDETIWPAYFDDNDMHQRMKLQHLGITHVDDCTANHGEGSATIKSYGVEEINRHHQQFRRNQHYFILKWGGMPGEETYNIPFNGNNIMPLMRMLYETYGF